MGKITDYWIKTMSYNLMVPNFWDALTPDPSRDSDKQHKDSVPNIYLSFFCTASYSLILSMLKVPVIFVVCVVYTGTVRENKFFF